MNQQQQPMNPQHQPQIRALSIGTLEIRQTNERTTQQSTQENIEHKSK